jgi:hypothetical protein
VVKIRGKPLIVPNDGVDHYDAPQGCIAMLGTGNCSFMLASGEEICCCFRGPDSSYCEGNTAMNCTNETRKDGITVAYKRIN